VIAPKALPQPSVDRPERAGRGRIHVRARDAARKRARISLAVVVVLAPIMGYVLLMGNLTALNYSLAQAQAQRSDLQEETSRLDDRIAALESRDRLADVAARLHMHDPQTFAVVAVPAPVATPPSGIAFLGSLFHR
jgi:cell division protein FtsL